MKETLIKAGLSAGVAGIASSILFGNGTVNALGMDLSAPILAGGSVGLGSIASDLLSDNLIENMNLPTNVKSVEEMLIRVGVCGAASTGALVYFGVPLSNAPTTFALGAGSKLGGDYLEDKLFGQKGMLVPMF